MYWCLIYSTTKVKFKTIWQNSPGGTSLFPLSLAKQGRDEYQEHYTIIYTSSNQRSIKSGPDFNSCIIHSFGGQSMHWLLFKPDPTTATFFCPQDGRCGEVHLLSLHFFNRSSGENLLKYQLDSSSLIMTPILMTTLFSKAMILLGEISCWSLLGLKGLRQQRPCVIYHMVLT